MISIAVGSVMFHRRLIEMFSEDVKKMWNECLLRGLVFLSVILQLVQLLLGKRRKYNPRTRIRITLWTAYLLANTVATAALGAIIQSALDVCNNSPSHPNSNTSELMSFWAPFLLIHLGGPDTITAYSLEDNKLWLRHLAELMLQNAMAIYILMLTLPGCSWLPILSIFVYVVGFIKCFERLLALRSANSKQLRDSMLGSPDPGPNFHKFMEGLALKRAQGFHVEVVEVPEPFLPTYDITYREDQGKLISNAYDLFQTFKRLFVDLILTFEHRDGSQSYFRHLTSKEAFHIIEVELGFTYDILYTKAKVAYTFVGLTLRLISFSFILLVLMGTLLLSDMKDYHRIDLAITYLLFSVALVMEISGFIAMLCSDWMDHWLSQHNKTREVLVLPFLKQPKKSSWSYSMAQYNLLSVCLEEKPAFCYNIQMLIGIDEYRVLHRYKTYCKVSDNLKELIYTQFHKFMGSSSDPRDLCTHRGSFALRENDCVPLQWSISKVEFDQSILIWHIATTICYHLEAGDEDKVHAISHCMESKQISDYLLYLLVTYPFMLPIGIGLIRYRDTCAEAVRFFKQKSPIHGKAEACKKLLQVNSTEVLPEQVKGDRCKSVLFDACRLVISLRTMEKEQMWKVMSQVWVEILAYAATHCRGNPHSQQLRKGGEFLTHVWLLMAHLGITEQFQVSQGHARARLNVT